MNSTYSKYLDERENIRQCNYLKQLEDNFHVNFNSKNSINLCTLQSSLQLSMPHSIRQR